jgi:nucleotide-binding universal stress UspA family protein
MEPVAPISPAVTKILVATDFSETAAVALEWASELARQHGATLELLHAVTVPPSMPDYVPAPGLDFTADLERAARDRIAETAQPLRERGIEVDTHLALGTPSQVILQRAEQIQAGMIVQGTRGLTGIRHLLLGSTAQRVVQKAPCPVLSVHPEDRGRHRPIHTILVPTDFSHDAGQAIATAHRLLSPIERDARLILLHAFNLPIEYTAYGPIPTSVHYLKDTGLEAERRLHEIAQPLRREGLEVETVALEGDPAGLVADEAERRGVDLIAMGTRGLTGIRHLLLGSIAERVVQKAPCPVLTVRRAQE